MQQIRQHLSVSVAGEGRTSLGERLWGVAAAVRALGTHSPLITVLAVIGALSGLSIAMLLSQDLRESAAYAVACVMIGGAMAVGTRGQRESLAPPEAPTASPSPAPGGGDEPGLQPALQPSLQEVRAVAHDLRAPLLSISSYLDLVASGAFGEVSDEAAAAVRRAAQLAERAQTVVSSALRAEGTPPALETRRVDLRHTISEVATALTASMREREATIAIEGRLPAVRAEEDALFRVFTNLVQNSIKFCPDARTPRITVSARRLDATTIEVTLLDNGSGLPSDDSLLRPGVRGVNAAGIAGYGLGLATVARLLARMDGTLTLDEAPGGGARARITLPAA